ncbi:hypothetical protein BV25DRAFT_21067 [Artomyces pyxidatus]|uniref:Uncharacterized protein n=1 Tax=Artomyces pyxidatus TaxID=48021 RepID=A0ACB8TJT3_9AGAM|nr:hypothetical protein BV25DRAFT_21067 [Artomyces pyxidatus]
MGRARRADILPAIAIAREMGRLWDVRSWRNCWRESLRVSKSSILAFELWIICCGSTDVDDVRRTRRPSRSVSRVSRGSDRREALLILSLDSAHLIPYSVWEDQSLHDMDIQSCIRAGATFALKSGQARARAVAARTPSSDAAACAGFHHLG